MKSTQVTRDEARMLLMKIGTLLTAMGDGTLEIIETESTPAPTPVKLTTKELRARAAILNADHQTQGDGASALKKTPAKKKEARAPQSGPRVVYQFKTPRGKVDLSDVPPAARTIANYLALNQEAAIPKIMADTKLKRSTVMNNLSELKQRGLVDVVSMREMNQ
jgi:hypothetical protein